MGVPLFEFDEFSAIAAAIQTNATIDRAYVGNNFAAWDGRKLPRSDGQIDGAQSQVRVCTDDFNIVRQFEGLPQ
jgi:hypothetical protein